MPHRQISRRLCWHAREWPSKRPSKRPTDRKAFCTQD